MQLPFGQYQFSYQEQSGKKLIFDIIRKKYIALTAEEWVRQHILHFMIEALEYPKGLIAVEMGLRVNDLFKRADIVVYNNSGQPIMLVECKAPEIKLAQHIFDQAARYNLALRVPFLVITNGENTLCSRIHFENNSFEILNTFPDFKFICTE